MSAPTSTSAVIAALAGNGLVATIKFIAFTLSGSAAMLSESVHSVADTLNQALLLLGLARGTRESDDEFQYGYGGERFVFGLLSAAGIFFLGCGVTVYHGVTTLLKPELLRVSPLTYGVLAASLLIEGSVLVYAIIKAKKAAPGLSLWASYRRGMDPATLAILLEDGAAVFGVLLATAAIFTSELTQNPIFDSIASIIVGLMLGAIALFLVTENRGLLLGRAVPPDVKERFLEVLHRWPSVRHVRDVKSRQITPEVYLFKAEIAFHPEYLANWMESLLSAHPTPSPDDRRRLATELSRAAMMAIATEIDAIEQAIRQEIPQARHIDLELDRLRSGSGGSTTLSTATTGPSAPASG